jgi:uncharacterized protein
MAHPRRNPRRRSPVRNEVVFVDTGFWIALLRGRDQLGDRALKWKYWIDEHAIPLCTTDAVLWELLNALAAGELRSLAAAVFRQCHQDRSIEVVPWHAEKVEPAFALYESRPDKDWSLTDCLSFTIMQERRLTDALTADHHFAQAGFRALLLDDPPS